MKSFGLILLFLSILVITTEAANKWYDAVSGYNQWNSVYGYAGEFGVPVTALRVSGGKPYRVHLLNGGWLDQVSGNDKDNHMYGYAGTKKGDVIDAIAVSGNVNYAVHVMDQNRWLPSVRGYDVSDDDYGYAGIYGHAIDAVMIEGRTYATARYVAENSDNRYINGGDDYSGENYVQRFIRQLSELAMNEAKKRKSRGEKWTLPSVCIAQAALETGWGTSGLMVTAKAYFGIKATSNWTGKVYSSYTNECYDGVNMTQIYDYFRAYDSVEESVADYFDLITKLDRYAKACNVTNARTCITEIKNGGYATAPDYVSSIMGIINDYNLTQYDYVVY